MPLATNSIINDTIDQINRDAEAAVRARAHKLIQSITTRQAQIADLKRQLIKDREELVAISLTPISPAQVLTDEVPF